MPTYFLTFFVVRAYFMHNKKQSRTTASKCKRMNIIDVGLWSMTMPVTSGSVSITSEAKTLFP